jgi:hypothetical protein
VKGPTLLDVAFHDSLNASELRCVWEEITLFGVLMVVHGFAPGLAIDKEVFGCSLVLARYTLCLEGDGIQSADDAVVGKCHFVLRHNMLRGRTAKMGQFRIKRGKICDRTLLENDSVDMSGFGLSAHYEDITMKAVTRLLSGLLGLIHRCEVQQYKGKGRCCTLVRNDVPTLVRLH